MLKSRSNAITNVLFTKSQDSFELFEGGDKKKNEDAGGFKCIPETMRKLDSEEAEAVRTTLMMLGFLHIVSIALEIFLYNFKVSMLFTEGVYLWLAYYCYMTMSSMFLWLYIGLMVIGTGLGLFNVFSIGGWFIIYLAQVAADGWLAYSLILAVKEWSNSKHEPKKKAAKEAAQKDEESKSQEPVGNIQDQIVNKVSKNVADQLLKEAREQTKNMAKTVKNAAK